MYSMKLISFLEQGFSNIPRYKPFQPDWLPQPTLLVGQVWFAGLAELAGQAGLVSLENPIGLVEASVLAWLADQFWLVVSPGP